MSEEKEFEVTIVRRYVKKVRVKGADIRSVRRRVVLDIGTRECSMRDGEFLEDNSAIRGVEEVK